MINNQVMVNDGGSGGKSVTGLNENYVTETIEQFNTDAETALEELTTKLNKVLAKIADNWGTADAVTHITDNVVPAFNNLEEKVADMIENIGKTIRNTGIQQAADSKNVITPTLARRPLPGVLINNMKDKLDNGYIGVYSTLKQEVTEAQEELITELLAKLAKLKQNAVEKCSKAFTDEGTSNVAAKCDEFIEAIKNSINTSFGEVKNSIDELTSSATTFAKEIQSAGLRSVAAGVVEGASSVASAVTSGVAAGASAGAAGGVGGGIAGASSVASTTMVR